MAGVPQRSGPPGNKNSSAEKRLFASAVRRAAVQEDGKALRDIVDELFARGKAGDVQAIKEIGDRLDGKSAQMIVGADNGPLVVQLVKFEESK